MRARLKVGLSRVVMAGAGLAIGLLFNSQVAQAQSTSSFPPFEGPPTQRIDTGKYVGGEICAGCHLSEAKVEGGNSMARAMEPVATCKILRTHPRLTFHKSTYTYDIIRTGSGSVFRVTDGVHTVAEPILWAFGQGKAGQTYVFRHNGHYVQSRVSFYNDSQSLGVTLGVPDAPPATIEEAMGEVISETEETLCFGCHSTGAVRSNRLEVEQLIPGITCEGCHGPGGKHVAAVQAGKDAKSSIFNPGRLSPGDLVGFCGSCHRTWQQVAMMQISGIRDVRFQPYRLANSRCFNEDDPRISCLACHNPHRAVRTEVAYYDAKCLACHEDPPARLAGGRATNGETAKPCPVGDKNCVVCHMAKYALPGAHFRFSDHEIRIVRKGEPYPD